MICKRQVTTVSMANRAQQLNITFPLSKTVQEAVFFMARPHGHPRLHPRRGKQTIMTSFHTFCDSPNLSPAPYPKLLGDGKKEDPHF
ncbi:hypothetical protein CDAR_416601 [Caerostris darwini]|uniref:Uncharacterized protein n=1 Tax=Caerostris darwini TaxID=1538125 RepID=A0AAV4MJC9_9ARAC|nr:hypothetical protein CDAR_416601 [Caerostris darwini]